MWRVLQVPWGGCIRCASERHLEYRIRNNKVFDLCSQRQLFWSCSVPGCVEQLPCTLKRPTDTTAWGRVCPASITKRPFYRIKCPHRKTNARQSASLEISFYIAMGFQILSRQIRVFYWSIVKLNSLSVCVSIVPCVSLWILHIFFCFGQLRRIS